SGCPARVAGARAPAPHTLPYNARAAGCSRAPVFLLTRSPMPIYEYECTKGGHYLEALQKMADKPLRECPECGKHALKRLVSAPMFRLSGSGWDETAFQATHGTQR